MDAKINLSEKTALVTGGGTGIGKGCARALLHANANVTIAGPEEDVLKRAAKELSSEAPSESSIDYILCDITNETMVKDAAAFASKGKNLDIAVANAGTGMPGHILALSADEWKSLCEINVVGTAMTVKHAALIMKAHGGGSIIAISSLSSQRAEIFMAPYSVTKAGVDRLVQCAAVELGPFNIRINCIRPGYIVTEATEMAFNDEMKQSCIRQTPLGRSGLPEDVAKSVLYFASNQADWVTDQLVSVCGGYGVPKGENFEHVARMVHGDETVDRCLLG